MAKERGRKPIAVNRRARHEYHIEDTLEAGLVLQGTEVKSLREGRVNLSDGYAYIDGGEAWLDAVTIVEFGAGSWTNHAPRRKRKLLLHKEQIVRWGSKTREGGYTIIPLSLYFSDGRVKVEIGLAKGKKDWDKRQAIRERDDKREAERAMRTRNRLGE